MSFSLKPEQPKLTTEKHPESDITAIFDLDYVKYSVASVGEKRSILVTHKKTGKKKEFENRTAFWGRGGKIGGWLGEQNKKRIEKGLKPFEKEDFEIEDLQEPEPLENVLHSAKQMVLSALDALGTDKYECYLGEGDSFRVNVSTLLKYKGNRDDAIRPVLLKEVTDYLVRTFQPKVVTGIEADDAVVIRAIGDPNAVVVAVDKDTYSQPVRVFNPNRPEQGIVNCDCFGKLWMEGNKVRGKGRIHLYYQIASQDNVDNFKLSCFSDKKWGAKSAYKALVDCKDDKEALEKLIEIAKNLYPEPKVVTGWRGNQFTIDWLYVLRECFLMAKMKYSDYDHTTFDDWLTKYGVEYEY